MNVKPKLPKGFRDFDSNTLEKREYIIKTISDVFKSYSFQKIETPSVESIETLSGKYGDEADKLIFKILNSGNYLSDYDLNNNADYKELTRFISKKALRYDLTVPLARYISQNINNISLPFKRYQMQNVWRADKPQKGRFREFMQCDADIIGSKNLINEYELIRIYDKVFEKLNLAGTIISINSRKILTAVASKLNVEDKFSEFVILLDKYDKIGKIKFIEELKNFNILKKDSDFLIKIIENPDVDYIKSYLSEFGISSEGFDDCKYIFEKLKLTSNFCEIKFNFKLARGLDYYTGTIFEVENSKVKIGALGGGGRYDNLTSIFGNNELSGVGISFGLDRIYYCLSELSLFKSSNDLNKTLFLNFGEREFNYNLKVLDIFRDSGISASIYADFSKIKKQMNYANNLNYKFVVICGENEIKSRLVTLKNMKTGNQITDKVEKIIKLILSEKAD